MIANTIIKVSLSLNSNLKIHFFGNKILKIYTTDFQIKFFLDNMQLHLQYLAYKTNSFSFAF